MSTATTTRPAPHALRSVALALVLLMGLTRFGHFGEFSRLPDASWAVFFLGGLLLRDARAFAAFFGLAWVVDLASVAAGTPLDCFSVAYLFLVPAYAALWFAGRGLAPWMAARREPTARLRSIMAAAALALAIGVTSAFAIANLGFWAFGTGVGPMPAAEYAARVAHYLPGYLLVAALYVAGALGAQRLVERVSGEARTAA
jgi:hypothetical protein